MYFKIKINHKIFPKYFHNKVSFILTFQQVKILEEENNEFQIVLLDWKYIANLKLLREDIQCLLYCEELGSYLLQWINSRILGRSPVSKQVPNRVYKLKPAHGFFTSIKKTPTTQQGVFWSCWNFCVILEVPYMGYFKVKPT